MSSVVDREELVEDVVRLRRAERESPDNDDIAAVRRRLERAVGPTVGRARAARLLGVSQTALDRWIASGDVPQVIAPNGRREVPLHALVDLIEAVRPEPGLRPLAAVLRKRRADAERLDPREVLPDRYRRGGTAGHRGAELRSLAYHRAVAQRLNRQIVEDARRRLQEWTSEGKIGRRYASEWEEILSRPVPYIARLISQDSQRARDLRQNSPFAGVLTEPERRRVLEAVA